MSTSSFSDALDGLSDSSFHQLDGNSIQSTILQPQVSNPSSAASSVPNTDEEDDDAAADKKQTHKERRREAHTQAEKKRREAIRKGYADLQELVPNCSQLNDSVTLQKISKAVVLQRSLDYIEFLQQSNEKQADELAKLRKEKIALTIMKESYEKIVEQHRKSAGSNRGNISEEVKFAIFQQIMEKLFMSFNNTVSTSSFQELSVCVIGWIEEHCKPQNFKAAVREVLTNLHNNNTLSS